MSKRQIEANRRNSQKSTGPKTEAGKAISKMNALKTGLYAESLILPTEKAEDYAALVTEYYDYYQPDNPDFRDLVNDYVAIVWQLRRLGITEVQIYKYQEDCFWRPDEVNFPQGKIASSCYTQFAALQKRLDSTRRSRDKVRDSLHRARAEQIARAEQTATAEDAPKSAAQQSESDAPAPAPSVPEPRPRNGSNTFSSDALDMNWLPSAKSAPKPKTPIESEAQADKPKEDNR